jgi:hypothetical protein
LNPVRLLALLSLGSVLAAPTVIALVGVMFDERGPRGRADWVNAWSVIAFALCLLAVLVFGVAALFGVRV